MQKIHIQDKLLNSNDYINNSVSKKYCSKCLSLLDGERVRDHENNEFCSESCRREFRLEQHQDIDDILSNFR